MAICLTIAIIDAKTMTIPDLLNFLLALVGLYGVSTGLLTDCVDAILGMLGGGLLSFGLRCFYLKWKGLEALGLGDVKFISAAGAWIGLAGIPPFLFLASSAGILYHVIHHRGKATYNKQERIPFAPFLCFGLVTVVWAQRSFAFPEFI